MAIFPGGISTDSDLYVAVNDKFTTLTLALSNVDTTVTVSDTTGFPTVGFITADLEIIKYTGKTPTTFTGCTRGSDGTTAVSHLAGINIFHYVIAIHHNVLKDEVKAIESTLINYVTVKDFGAVGDGVTNDTVAIQAAIDSLSSTGGVVYFPKGQYRIARTIGTNDKWGLKITANNITLRGDGASLRRFNTDISTYALSYPLIFVGTPDSNVAATTLNTTITGFTFIGEDTRHSSPGSTIHDGRSAIEAKNTTALTVTNCRFTLIDSQAIYFQKPAEFDYANSVYYNTTKSYQAVITKNSFVANSHATVDRALMHAISIGGLDHVQINNNYFEWCDNCISYETTYGNPTQIETDLYPSGTVVGSVKRSGRWLTFNDNVVYNSSEHAVYVGGMDVTIVGNTFRIDNSTVCSGDVKLRAANVSMSGNTILARNTCISITTPSTNIEVSGNIMYALTDSSAGVLDISSAGLSSYISARPWYGPFFAMSGMNIIGNTIERVSTAETNGYGIRLSADNSDANYPEGQIQDVVISGNTLRYPKHGVYFVGGLTQKVHINNNIIHGKPFTLAGFTTATTVNTESAINVEDANADLLIHVQFNNNTLYGSKYLFKTNTGTGTSVHLPWGIRDNRFDYIQFFKTADMRALDSYNKFNHNTGTHFLDRTWNGFGLENSLYDETTSTNSIYRYNQIWDGTSLKFYTDDAGTFLTTAFLSNTQTFTGTKTFTSSTGTGFGGVPTAVSNAGIDIYSGGLGLIGGADSGASTRTNATLKIFRIGLYHYTNAEEPSGIINGLVDSTQCLVRIGGGTSTLNAATDTQIYAAANTTTLTGTQVFSAKSTGVGFLGTTTNDNATTGWVGQYIESIVAAQNVGANGTRSDITSISLTAGDWDIDAGWLLDRTGATFSSTNFEILTSTTSGNNTTGSVAGSSYFIAQDVAPTTFSFFSMVIPRLRVSVSATTTYYLKGFVASYSAATPRYWARLSARRVR